MSPPQKRLPVNTLSEVASSSLYILTWTLFSIALTISFYLPLEYKCHTGMDLKLLTVQSYVPRTVPGILLAFNKHL